MRRAAPLALMLTLSACWFSHAPDVKTFTVLGVTGEATQRTTAGQSRALAAKMTVPLGAIVRVANGGVTLGRGRSTIEVRPAQAAQDASLTLVSLDQVDVGSGFVLASIDAGAPIQVSSQDVSASVAQTGVFRFDRKLSIRIGSYDGDVTVTTAEGDLHLKTLQEAVVAGRVLPRAATPYAIDPADQWDRKELSDVIALDEALRTQALGYERQTGAHFASISQLALIAKDLGTDLSFAQGFLATMSRGDVLIGIELAVIVARADKTDPASAFGALVSQFNAGATWGELAKPVKGAVSNLRTAVERGIAILFNELRPSPSPTPSTSTSPSAQPTKSATPTPTPTNTSTRPPPHSLGPPTTLTAVNGACNALQSTAVDLAWRASASPDAGGYEIFRSAGGAFTSIGRVDGRNTTTFTDQSVDFSKTYSYKVRTVRGNERSTFSNVATATTKSNICT